MRFALQAFGHVLAQQDGNGKPYLLIGGQAVYFWASRYAAEEPAVEQWRPFTSKDIDFQGGREDVLRIAKGLGMRAQFPHSREMTALAGIVSFLVGGSPTTIEVLRLIPGVRPNVVERLAADYEFAGYRVRVVDPISLLSCKLYLALNVDQRERRDVEHLRIMLLCVRAFLRETLRGVEDGTLPARGWLGALERVLKLAESGRGKKVVRAFAVDWTQALPLTEIAVSNHRLVKRFSENRFVRWQAKLVRMA
ncbi:MAG: hypothetical protein NTX51_15570 [Verrucomicrobia bacterium]|nr:hypothetical protein [Verrucomicrobiota bacterium]